MARRPASGRGWTDDGRATGKSFRDPMEAWWKHKGENGCAILTICSQFGLVARSRNWQDMRKKTRFVAPDRVAFDTTHNLKVAGSNPAPATKKSKHIRSLESDANRRVIGAPLYMNATATPHQKNRNRTHKPAAVGSSGQRASDGERPAVRKWGRVSTIASGHLGADIFWPDLG